MEGEEGRVATMTNFSTDADRRTSDEVWREGGMPKSRRRLGGALLAIGIALALVFGGWGGVVSLKADPPPARVGEGAEVPGGTFRVDQVIPEHMAPMQMQNFARAGMNMSGMVADMTPEGKRRFNVEFTVSAQDGEMAYSPTDFRLSGRGVDGIAPIKSELGSNSLPAGGTVSGTLTFQVPEEAEGLALSFDGGRPVALALPPETGGPKHH